MHARSALFDVYGDHLRTRDHRAAVAGLVRLLEPVGIAAPAVRTAISRMVGQGWLEPVTVDGSRGYAATERAIRRLGETSHRIYEQRHDAWDGTWQLVALDPFTGRVSRAAALRELPFLGYAQLDDRLWVSPFARPALAETLRRIGASATTCQAQRFTPADAPLRAWDLDALAASYAGWHRTATAAADARLEAHQDPEAAAFTARFHLVHEWRKFLFTDPGLPDELLPDDWPGHAAAAYFRAEADRLAAASQAFVARALDGSEPSLPSPPRTGDASGRLRA